MDRFPAAVVFRQDCGGRLPLWTCRVSPGRHPERQFHSHDHLEVVIIVQGTALHLADNATAAVKAGDVLVLRPGVVHAYDHTADLELFNLLYYQEKLPLPLLDARSMPLAGVFLPVEGGVDWPSAKPVMSLGPEESRRVVERLQELDDELRDIRPGNSFFCLALFMELLARLARHGDGARARQARSLIAAVVEHINKNYRRQLEVEELVSLAKMSRRNFFRHFQEATGRGPGEYARLVRVGRAAELLLSTSLSIAEVAADCGFSDSNYFCRAFREAMGTSPGQFRQTSRRPSGQ